MDELNRSLLAIALAIVGVATLSVLVSPKAKTTDVINAGGNAFGNVLGVAISPVTGGATGGAFNTSFTPSYGFSVNG